MKIIFYLLIIGLGFTVGRTYAEVGTQTKEAIEKDLEQGIQKLRIQLKDLQAKADKATGSAKKDINEKIDELKSEENKLHTQVEHVKGASGKAWEDIKKGAQSALESLSKSLKDAKERFK